MYRHPFTNKEKDETEMSVQEIQQPKETRKSRSKKSKSEEMRCDFCGKTFATNESTAERRKYCSESCRSRANRGRVTVRLANPPSKRYAARLRFTNPLYFN